MDYIEIFSNSKDLTEGIFGQCLIWIIEVLYYLEKINKIKNNTCVTFNINTLNNDNLIPKFIEPKILHNKILEPTKIPLHKFYTETVSKDNLDVNFGSYNKANKIFDKYFKFNDFIINEVNKLNINNKTLGVHYRGTDKNYDTSQANFITTKEMVLIVTDYIKNNDVEKIFCCSDEQVFINEVTRLFPNKVIQYKQLRSPEAVNYGLFRYGQNNVNKDFLTNACIIDMLALSKCKTVIKSSSALSCFSKILNPSLQLYTVSAMKYPWFPTCVVNKYETSSEIIKKILNRTMKDDCFNK